MHTTKTAKRSFSVVCGISFNRDFLILRHARSSIVLYIFKLKSSLTIVELRQFFFTATFDVYIKMNLYPVFELNDIFSQTIIYINLRKSNGEKRFSRGLLLKCCILKKLISFSLFNLWNFARFICCCEHIQNRVTFFTCLVAAKKKNNIVTSTWSKQVTYSTSNLKGKIHMLWKDFIKSRVCKASLSLLIVSKLRLS